jgi:hypothetical protein
MCSKKQAHLQWQVREDGSSWAPFEVGGESGVVAVVPLSSEGTSATAIIEFKQLGPDAEVEEARNAVENWLLEIGGRALASPSVSSSEMSSNRRRSS